MGRIDDRMRALGIELPPPWTPRGGCPPLRRDGHVVRLSGQVCERAGIVVCEGPVGDGSKTIEAAREAPPERGTSARRTTAREATPG